MKKILLITLNIVLLFSCTKKNTTELLPTPTGSITGKVLLYNAQHALAQNASGVIVSLDSTSYSTTTDSMGTYTLANIPQGIYTVSYSKNGYSTHKMLNYTIDAGSSPIVVSNNSLYAPIASKINNFTAVLDSPSVNLIGTINPPINSANIYLYFAQIYVSTSPQVSSVNYESYTNITIGNLGNDSSFSYNYYPYYNNFTSGTKLYLIAYPFYVYSGSYTNPATGHTIFEGLGTPSKVISVTLP